MEYLEWYYAIVMSYGFLLLVVAGILSLAEYISYWKLTKYRLMLIDTSLVIKAMERYIVVLGSVLVIYCVARIVYPYFNQFSSLALVVFSMVMLVKILRLPKQYEFSQSAKQRFHRVGGISIGLIGIMLVALLMLSNQYPEMVMVGAWWNYCSISVLLVMWLMLARKAQIDEWEKQIGVVTLCYEAGEQVTCKDVPFTELQATKQYIYFSDKKTQQKVTICQQQLVELRHSHY